MLALEIAVWGSLGLIAYTHVGYPAILWVARLSGIARATPPPPSAATLPRVSLVVAAYDEEEVIEAKLKGLRRLEYPPELVEVIVASDGSTDATVERARAEGADLVLDLPRRGKIAAQDAAVEAASGEIVAFSDANAHWEPAALAALVEAFLDPEVGYACGQVVFERRGGDNEEGAYWRYEMAVRELESSLWGITAGNGGIYAVRRRAYRPSRPHSSHDLSLPFWLAREGWRSVYVPAARALERLVPTMAGEYRRKRRMMRGVWAIVFRDGMLDPRGYPLRFAFALGSHRLLRYASPFLHLTALAANVALVALGAGLAYQLLLACQLAVPAGALAARLGGASLPGPLGRAFALCRYYVLVTASVAAGLWDYLTGPAPGTWEKAEGTR